MMHTNSIYEIIPKRKSVRTYKDEPVAEAVLRKIEDSLRHLPIPPLHSKSRFILAAAAEGDAEALKGLGTYGIIRKPAGFVIGAVQDDPDGLVDFGFQMQAIVLMLTDLGLGSCWLGGSFRKSRFSERIAAAGGECVPSVLSFGIPAEKPGMLETLMRAGAGSDRRKTFESLFFKSDFSRPLSREEAGSYGRILDMVRLAPSASNRQPWRIVLDSESGAFHFFQRREGGYGRRLRWFKLLDLQRVDMGIAACHFGLAAAESGLPGAWTVRDQGSTATLPENTIYIMTWNFSKS
jgi:nitroreductase